MFNKFFSNSENRIGVIYIIIVISVILLIWDCIYLAICNNIIAFDKILLISCIIAIIGLLLYRTERKNKESLFKQEQDKVVYNAILGLEDEEKKLSILKELINME